MDTVPKGENFESGQTKKSDEGSTGDVTESPILEIDALVAMLWLEVSRRHYRGSKDGKGGQDGGATLGKEKCVNVRTMMQSQLFR